MKTSNVIGQQKSRGIARAAVSYVAASPWPRLSVEDDAADENAEEDAAIFLGNHDVSIIISSMSVLLVRWW